MSPWYYLKTRTFREIDCIDLGYIVGRSIPAHFMGKFLCRQVAHYLTRQARLEDKRRLGTYPQTLLRVTESCDTPLTIV